MHYHQPIPDPHLSHHPHLQSRPRRLNPHRPSLDPHPLNPHLQSRPRRLIRHLSHLRNLPSRPRRPRRLIRHLSHHPHLQSRPHRLNPPPLRLSHHHHQSLRHQILHGLNPHLRRQYLHHHLIHRQIPGPHPLQHHLVQGQPYLRAESMASKEPQRVRGMRSPRRHSDQSELGSDPIHLHLGMPDYDPIMHL